MSSQIVFNRFNTSDVSFETIRFCLTNGCFGALGGCAQCRRTQIYYIIVFITFVIIGLSALFSREILVEKWAHIYENIQSIVAKKAVLLQKDPPNSPNSPIDYWVRLCTYRTRRSLPYT